MRKSKFWLFFGMFLIIIGVSGGVVLLANENFEIEKFLINSSEEKEYILEDGKTINKIYLNLANSDIDFVSSVDEKIKIKYITNNNQKVKITTEDMVLKVEASYEFASFDRFALFRKNFSYKMEIHMPDNLEVEIDNKNSQIEIENVSFVNLDIKTTNGDILLKNVITVNDINFSTINGQFMVNAVTAKKLELKKTNGVIRIENSFFEETSIKTTNSKIFIDKTVSPKLTVTSTNGNINCHDIVSDFLKLNTVNGDIYFTVKGNINDYSIKVSTTFGKTNLSEKGNGTKKIEVKTINGNITGEFV